MFNLTEIMEQAQSGKAFETLAAQYGISPEQAQAATSAFLPGLSMGLQNKAGTPDGFANLMEVMTGQAYQKAFAAPEEASKPETIDAGQNALGNIFGSDAAQQAIAQHAAAMSGISNQIMQAMMPAITAMVIGGLTKAATNHGLGSLFNAASAGNLMGMLQQMMTQAGGTTAGGLGGMLNQMMHPGGQPAAPPQPAQASNPAQMWTQMWGQMMGAGQPAPAPVPQGPTPIQAGLEMFQAMLNHGQQVHETQARTLQNIFETLVKHEPGGSRNGEA